MMFELLLRFRLLILQSAAWCVGLSWLVPPWQVIRTTLRPGTVRIQYLFAPQTCNCPRCRAGRGEINGQPMLGEHGRGPWA